MNKNIPTEIERFDLSARVQHIILFTSFLVLAFTGWGLKYAYQEPASAWIRFWGGAKSAGIIHRVAGIILLLDFIYHQFYMLNLIQEKGPSPDDRAHAQRPAGCYSKLQVLPRALERKAPLREVHRISRSSIIGLFTGA